MEPHSASTHWKQGTCLQGPRRQNSMAATRNRCVVHRTGAPALLPDELFDALTGGTLTTGTFRLYPVHCRVPTTSEGDRIIAAAADLLEALKGKEPESATQQRQHVKILKQLTQILHKPTQGRQEPRVDATPAPTGGAPSLSTNPTHPTTLRNTKRIHQRRTRNNNPYKPFLDEHQAA